jgi:hypothetical protein
MTVFALILFLTSWLTPVHLSAVLPQQPVQPPAQQPAPTALLPGTTLEQNVTGAEPHTYTVPLDQYDFLHLVVGQHGVDVTLRLLGPDGSLVMEQDSPNGPWGRKNCCFWLLPAGFTGWSLSPSPRLPSPMAKPGGGTFCRF